MRSLSRKNPSLTLIFSHFMEVLFFVIHLLIHIKFILLEQMIRNTMLISLTFPFIINSERYAEDNKVHLKAKNKEM